MERVLIPERRFFQVRQREVHRASRWPVFLRDMAIVVGLIGIYFLVRGLAPDRIAQSVELTTWLIKFEQALHIFREIGDRDGESRVLNNLANAYLDQGNYDEARAHFEQSLRLRREVGNRQGEGLTLMNLGLLFHRLGDDESAREHSQQAILIAQELGDRSTQGNALTVLGHALASPGYLAEAAHAYQESLDLWRELGRLNLAMEPCLAWPASAWPRVT